MGSTTATPNTNPSPLLFLGDVYLLPQKSSSSPMLSYPPYLGHYLDPVLALQRVGEGRKQSCKA